MKTSDAISYFGNNSKVARALTADGWRITPQAVRNWKEYPPMGRQIQMNKLSGGELKVTPEQDQDHAA